MTYRNNLLRPGLTAIAAVLALSSTPSFAQDAATAVDAPPTPVVAAEPITEPAPAPEPAAAEVAPSVAESSPASVGASAPQARPTARSAASVRRAAAPARTPAVSPVASASAPAAAVETAAVTPAPPATPVQSEALPPIPVQPVAPAPVEASAGDDILPIAGVAGAGVLALLGGAVALNRRRRRSDEVGYEPETLDSDHVAPMAPEPTPATPVAARAMPEVAAVPAGFDLSRYGRHTQAAYRGPTPDNPSLSLKRRLKRATFLDGRERMTGESVAAAEPLPMSAVARDAVTTKVAQAPEQPKAPAFAPRRTTRPTSQPLFGFQQPAFQN